MGYHPTNNCLSNQWTQPKAHSFAVNQLQSRQITIPSPRRNLTSSPVLKNAFAPSPKNNPFGPSPVKNLFAPSPERKLFGPSPVSSPVPDKVVFCAPSPIVSKRKYQCSWEEKKEDPWKDLFRANPRSIPQCEKKLESVWAFKEMIRENKDHNDRGQRRHFNQRSNSRGKNQIRSASISQSESRCIQKDSGPGANPQQRSKIQSPSEDGIRLDYLKCKPDSVPEIEKCKNLDLPKYDLLKKFNWNGLSGRSYAAQQNLLLTQREGHGIACNCQSCSNIGEKENKRKGPAQNKPAISILHEIASWENANIYLMITCGGCGLRLRDGAAKGGVCPRCGEKIHPKKSEYGYSWNDQYLEGVFGASNNKEAKRLAADKALIILEKDWNYGEQITRCAKGSKALPRDPGRYVFVSNRGEFVPYDGNGITLRDRIFEQQRMWQEISYAVAPNFDWRKFDKKMKPQKEISSVKNVPAEPVEVPEIIKENCNIPKSNAIPPKKKEEY